MGGKMMLVVTGILAVAVSSAVARSGGGSRGATAHRSAPVRKTSVAPMHRTSVATPVTRKTAPVARTTATKRSVTAVKKPVVAKKPIVAKKPVVGKTVRKTSKAVAKTSPARKLPTHAATTARGKTSLVAKNVPAMVPAKISKAKTVTKTTGKTGTAARKDTTVAKTTTSRKMPAKVFRDKGMSAPTTPTTAGSDWPYTQTRRFAPSTDFGKLIGTALRIASRVSARKRIGEEIGRLRTRVQELRARWSAVDDEVTAARGFVYSSRTPAVIDAAVAKADALAAKRDAVSAELARREADLARDEEVLEDLSGEMGSMDEHE